MEEQPRGAAYNPMKHGSKLDKLRHTDPKSARKMTRAGKRSQQYAAVADKLEETMETAQQARSRTSNWREAKGLRQISIAVAEATHQRWVTLRDTRNAGEFVEALLDAYEKRHEPAPPSVGPSHRIALPHPLFKRIDLAAAALGTDVVTLLSRALDEWERPSVTPAAPSALNAEAANILKDIQGKLQTATQTETVKRLVEQASRAKGRAERIASLEVNLTEANQRADRLAQELLVTKARAEQAEMVAATPPPPTATIEGADGLLFEFVDAATGMVATADASGEIVVQIAPEKLSAMFPIWQRAVRVLGIAGGKRIPLVTP